ncbi:MAG: VCBS repeat-containing protein [Planctomycetota bacterium]|nr:VCBS repeat-containing protein [Planctomycetota bacterium]
MIYYLDEWVDLGSESCFREWMPKSRALLRLSFVLLLILLGGCQSNLQVPTAQTPASIESKIAAFCGDCHALPSPESFAQDVWYEEIRKGYEFYARSGRSDLHPPMLSEVVRYYRERAPKEMVIQELPEVDELLRNRFEIEKVDWKEANDYIRPGVASVRWIPLMAPDHRDFVICDMRDGSVSLIDPANTDAPRKILARLNNPCRVEMCDLDADGYQDLLVADLGSFLPFDHQHGRVVFLRRDPATSNFAEIVVSQSNGRVADVQAGDFSGRGQLDILFAEFGHRQFGGIRMLSNMSDPNQPPRLVARSLDSRPGYIQLPPNDWDQDGRLDFAAVISQEYESVEIFLNRGSRFERRVIWQAPDLSFGSIGITLADLDEDGDKDILYANGDSFDNGYANRSHGLQWLENLGDVQFRYHRIADVPCIYRAVAIDFDADGDQDIVAVTNVPSSVNPATFRNSNPASIVLLEQTRSKHFELRVLERGSPNYPALEVGDFNQDGRMDFVVGAQIFDETSTKKMVPRLSVWWSAFNKKRLNTP